jgi:hypothetical protein
VKQYKRDRYTRKTYTPACHGGCKSLETP